MKQLVLIGLLGVMTPTLDAKESLPERNERWGWAWYEDPVDTEQIPPREVLPPPPSAKKLMTMHPDDAAKIIEAYFKEAVWQQDEESVRDYLLLQDAWRRKSLGYAGIYGLVLQNNPKLNPAVDNPLTNAGISASHQVRQQEIGDRLFAERDRYGLILFTQSHCPYCPVQKGITRFYQDRYGWQMSEVDINTYPALQAQFNVSVTPTLILVERNSNRWAMVGAGNIPLPEMEWAIYRAIRLMNKEIRPEQFYMLESDRNRTFDPTNPVE